MNLRATQDLLARLKQHNRQWWLGSGVPISIALILLVVISSQLASLTWLLFDTSPEFRMPVSQVATEGRKRAQSQTNWDALPLFGQVNTTQARQSLKIPPRVTNQQDSQILKKLNVKLVGVVASSEAVNSWIAVSDGGKVDIYNSGDEIKDGVSIEEIRAKEVTLRLGEVTEVITLMESDAARRPDSAKQMRANSKVPAAGTFRVTNAATRKRIADYQQALKTDPLSLFGKVSTVAVLRNNRVYGQRLRPGKDRTLLNDVGLRSGDILLAINGISVNDAANAGQIIESMASGGDSLLLKIERGGKVRDMRIELR